MIPVLIMRNGIPRRGRIDPITATAQGRGGTELLPERGAAGEVDEPLTRHRDQILRGDERIGIDLPRMPLHRDIGTEPELLQRASPRSD